MKNEDVVRVNLFNSEFISYVISSIGTSNALLKAMMNTLNIFSEKLPYGLAEEIQKTIFDEYDKLIEKEKEKVKLMDMDLSDKLKNDLREILENPPGSGTKP